MSTLRSKLGYSSPFDQALSKPLIDTQQGHDTTTSTSTSTSTSTNTSRTGTNTSTQPQPQQNHAAFSNKLSAQAPNKQNVYPPSSYSSYTYKPPTAILNDEEQQSLLLTQLVSESPSTLGTQIDHALLQERHNESYRITTQMRQIHEINQDLATLVESQQETIDIIEQDAYDIHDSTERGVGHLERAKGLMNGAMRSEGLMRVFFMVIAAGGLFIALILLLEAMM